MPTRSLRPTDETMLSDWEPIPERAPSIVAEERPTVARTLALVGFFLIAVGGIAVVAQAMQWRYLVSGAWGMVFGTTGLALILFHAFADTEVQVRRLYGFFAIVCLLSGVILRVLPNRAGTGVRFLPYGVPLMALGFLLALAVLRNETDVFWRTLLLRLVGALGVVMTVVAVIVGIIKPDFLAGEGIVLILMGTFFLGGFIGMQGVGSDAGYYTGLGLGAFAILVFAIAVFRSLTTRDYFVPSGLTLMATSLLHFGLALGICSDHPFVVLTRRELAAYFYSPIAFMVLIASIIAAAIWFFLIGTAILNAGGDGIAIPEPMIQHYLANFITLIIQMLVVPAITMRLLSEEKRSGTMEMLLTAPVNESSVVLAKFVAVWVFWLASWIPFFLFPVALRIVGGQEYDYRPALSFGIGVAVSGAGFLAMGLFFSSITRNQIIAAILTFAGLLTLLSVHLLLMILRPGPTWMEILTYVSFYDMWQSFAAGQFAPRYLLFHASLAVIFLFLSIKMLEARKWK